MRLLWPLREKDLIYMQKLQQTDPVWQSISCMFFWMRFCLVFSVSHSCTAQILASCSSRSAEQHQVIREFRQRSSLWNRHKRQDAQSARSLRRCPVFRVATRDRRELDANPLRRFSDAVVRNVGRGLVWFRFHLESSSDLTEYSFSC